VNDVAKKIKVIVDLGLRPSLRQAGFRKGGTHFSKIDQEALEIINVQSSQWNNASSGRFTLNVGVHFAAVARMLLGTDPMPAIPKEYYCLIRRRVGMLLPRENDHWWVVTTDTDAESLAAELSSAWRDYISPWLEKFKTIAGAARELEKDNGMYSWTAAAARLVLGEREKAIRLVETAIEFLRTNGDFAHPANAALTEKRVNEIRLWAAAHGLTGTTKT
jgi:hypothetical protein